MYHLPSLNHNITQIFYQSFQISSLNFCSILQTWGWHQSFILAFCEQIHHVPLLIFLKYFFFSHLNHLFPQQFSSKPCLSCQYSTFLSCVCVCISLMCMPTYTHFVRGSAFTINFKNDNIGLSTKNEHTI